MRSRSTAKAVRVGEASSGASRLAFAERVAISDRSLASRSSVCSRIRSAATERVRESRASARVCVAIVLPSVIGAAQRSGAPGSAALLTGLAEVPGERASLEEDEEPIEDVSDHHERE